MTICVAAICATDAVFGASDRMLTAGDVRFEPPQRKHWQLTNSIIAMIAGDSALQTEILQGVQRDVLSRIEKEPSNWWLVRDVAELYSRYYTEARNRRSETALLSRLGLSLSTFVSKQRDMLDSAVRSLSTELINFALPSVATIVAGRDPEGTHIFAVTELGSVFRYGVIE